MSPTILHKYKYFHSTVQRAKDRPQKFHFCRLPFDVTSSLISLITDNTYSIKILSKLDLSEFELFFMAPYTHF